MAAAAALARVRETCLALPETSERPSHGAPTFFIRGKRSFCMFVDDHHGDGRLAIWCAAPPGAQAMLVESNPRVYFVPPYVGVSGWVGVRLDRRVAWGEVAAVLEQAYRVRAPATVLRALDGQVTPGARPATARRAAPRRTRPPSGRGGARSGRPRGPG